MFYCKKKYLILLFLFFAISPSYSQKTITSNIYLEQAEKNKYTHFDSAIYFYKKSIDYNTEKKDTFNVIINLRDMSDLYAHRLDYGKAYDGYWKALFLADTSKDDYSKAIIFQALGWLYSFYDRDTEALKYYNSSLKLTASNINIGPIKKIELRLQDYFSILNLYRVKGDYRMAKVYADSSEIANNNLNNGQKNFYINTEIAFLNAIDKKYDLALSKLEESNIYFESSNPSYLIIVNYLIGEVYRLKGDFDKSILYFEKSLSFSKKYESHENYIIKDHEALALCYAKMGDFKRAYDHSNLAMKLNSAVFGKGSGNTQHLFEINDRYRVHKQRELELLNQQRIAKLESDKKVWLLKSMLYTLIICSLMIFGYLFVRSIRRNHKIEKRALAERQEMELQKGKDILELKNKELTISALQLIEKDEFIEKLKVNLTENKDQVDSRTINKLLRTIQGTPSSNWKEFDARFTAVNQSFYSNIKEKYPDLGQTDLKICALIKLNFSSKDMASLLGISFESVHTSRYRLRKKFNLDRNDNLNDFIAAF